VVLVSKDGRLPDGVEYSDLRGCSVRDHLRDRARDDMWEPEHLCRLFGEYAEQNRRPPKMCASFRPGPLGVACELGPAEIEGLLDLFTDEARERFVEWAVDVLAEEMMER